MTDAGRQAYVRGSVDRPLTSASIHDLLQAAVRTAPGRTAVVSVQQNRRLTFAEFDQEAAAAAPVLASLGVTRGDRVAIWSPNRIEWLVVFQAIARLGAIAVPLNPLYGEAELLAAVAHSDPVVVVAAGTNAESARRLPALAAACAARGLRARFVGFDGADADELRWANLRGVAVSPPEPSDADEIAAILYTSGTTGMPKGAAMSHRSLVNSGFFIGERLGYGPDDAVCVPVPLYHTFGLVLGYLAALSHTSAIVLPATVFDPLAVIDAVQRERCTSLYAVPSMFRAVLSHPRATPERFVSLRTGVMAGAACPPALLSDVMDRLHMPEVSVCYGMTEAGTICQSAATDPPALRCDTVGSVHPHVETAIVDPDSGRTLERGEVGELRARGYCLMSGYWRNDTATRSIIDADGWIRTGDLATMRADGCVSIVGRLKDMIIVAGRNIDPQEVEEALRAHPRVADAAVVGVPDEVYGEAVCAFVQARAGMPVDSDELRRFCRSRIGAYKSPRYVRPVDELPRTPTGKVQKFKLREWLAAENDATVRPKAETA